MIVYEYKEHYDSNAYGEEITLIFANKKDAIDHLKKRVEEHFVIPFEKIPQELDITDDSDDTFKEDYISIGDGDGTHFWVINEKNIIGETRINSRNGTNMRVSLEGKTTTELFNIFHDNYKEKITSHWAEKFRELSGISKEQTDACYWNNTEIPNDEEANAKLIDFLETLDFEEKFERDIELVIKLPEELFEILKNPKILSTMYHASRAADAVRNGTPLPKGHGCLIDINDIDVIELEDSAHIIRHEKGDDVDVYISAPIIIKADEAPAYAEKPAATRPEA